MILLRYMKCSSFIAFVFGIVVFLCLAIYILQGDSTIFDYIVAFAVFALFGVGGIVAVVLGEPLRKELLISQNGFILYEFSDKIILWRDVQKISVEIVQHKEIDEFEYAEGEDEEDYYWEQEMIAVEIKNHEKWLTVLEEEEKIKAKANLSNSNAPILFSPPSYMKNEKLCELLNEYLMSN